MATLNSEAIKKAHAAKGKVVPVAAWGGDVRLAKLGARQKVELGKSYAQLPKDEHGDPKPDTVELIDFVVALLSFSLVDDSGRQMFVGKEGREFLQGQDEDVLTDLAREAIELNGFTAAAETQLGETAEKN